MVTQGILIDEFFCTENVEISKFSKNEKITTILHKKHKKFNVLDIFIQELCFQHDPETGVIRPIKDTTAKTKLFESSYNY